MISRIVVAIVMLVVSSVFTGCAAIPSSGPVNAGRIQVGAESLEQELLAASPQPGASQTQILAGFIDAAVSPRNNYQIARQFLTSALADEWQPTAGATIDSLSARRTETLTADSLAVTATPVASLAGNGEYELASSAAPLSLTYQFAKVSGEWRISAAPSGILIDDGNFTRVYHRFDLIFFDPQYRFEVPDVRWFAGRDSVQTSIVRALLAGPAAWLAGGVVSAFPAGYSLQADSVPIIGDVATVSIDGATVDDVRVSQRMRYQLTQSLAGVRNTLTVRFTLNGVDQTTDTQFQPDIYPRTDTRPAVLSGTSFGYLEAPSKIVPIDGISDAVVSLQPTAVSLGPRAATAAVRAADGVYLVRAGAEPIRVDSRPGLIPPAIDVDNFVWTVPTGEPSSLVATGVDGKAIPIKAPWDDGTNIVALEPSRDGTRLVGLLSEGGRSRLLVASVQRNEVGLPEAINATPLVLQEVDGAPISVVWADGSTLAYLVSRENSTVIIQQPIGGDYVTEEAPAGSKSLDAGNSKTDIRVLTESGQIAAASGVGWQPRAEGIKLLAPQQGS